ncbi:hypothetical protein HJFPF1_08166 [Paramyrothecium foliicola]|nr:hypothetical protein HJFPF1_08166 [Paramyrothecium foliicola]
MSSFTLYDGTIPHARGALKTLLVLADKLEAHATSASIPVESLLQARLAEDMLPLTFQFHVVCDSSNKLVARLEGTEPAASSWEDLKTVDDLRTRVKQTIDLIEKAEKAKFVERTNETVTFGLGRGKNADVKAFEYANGYALPNIFFHVVAAYSILRSKGVQLGKQDYQSQFLGPYLSA